MIELGPARECDMVAAFPKAEILSPRYSSIILRNLAFYRLPENLINCPDLDSPIENHYRRELLKYRGYRTNSLLFAGFPKDVVWRSVKIEPKDHELLHCTNDRSADSWVRVSDDTRSIRRIAANLTRMERSTNRAQNETARRIRDIQKDLNEGQSMPPLIAVEGDDSRLILVEGNSRATAYVDINWQQGITMLLGRSFKMKDWTYY
jgi:hypothetical protein